MKKLWRRAAGKIKDRNSIWIANLARKSRYRQPELEAAVINATSHDDSFVDYKNAQRVFTWIHTSSSHLIVFLCALTRRVERTGSWIVALKSLILFHGVLCSKAPGTRNIGRLPFDLSSFDDVYTHRGYRRQARNEFVQAYFAFCDLKSVILSAELRDESAVMMMEDDKEELQMVLVRIKRWQELLDAVLKVRPLGGGIADEVVVLEAMDCMVIEVFELYSRICDGIATALMKIYTDKIGKTKAAMALNVLQNASRQGQDLSNYFQYCRKIGLMHATESPDIQQVPEEDFAELKRIICEAKDDYEENDTRNGNNSHAMLVLDELKHNDNQERNKPWLKTVITDKWEVFEEDFKKVGNAGSIKDPFAASLLVPSPRQYNPFIDSGGTPAQPVVSLI